MDGVRFADGVRPIIYMLYRVGMPERGPIFDNIQTFSAEE
jgi:hypothetical protein